MVEVIQARGGFVETFIGDAIVAVFYPEPERDFRRTAILTGLAMVRRHREILEDRRRSGSFPYGMGVGIEAGEIVGTTLVASGRRDFALFGKTRRQAERLEGFSKQGRHSRVVVSAALTRACPELPFHSLWEDAFEVGSVEVLE
jgi:class 3 adenylate cyclase